MEMNNIEETKKRQSEKEEKEGETAAENTEKDKLKKITPQKETLKKGQDSGFLKKVFQRKSVQSINNEQRTMNNI